MTFCYRLLACLTLPIITLTGCSKADDGLPDTTVEPYAIYNTSFSGSITQPSPFPSDMFFANSPDENQTLNFPSTVNSPTDPFVALNDLDGFSTNAHTSVDFNVFLEPSSIVADVNVHVFEVTIAIDTRTPQAITRKLIVDIDYTTSHTITDNPSGLTSRLLIKPLKRLPASTEPGLANGLMIVVTDTLKTIDGESVGATPGYARLRDGLDIIDSQGTILVANLELDAAQRLESTRDAVTAQLALADGAGINPAKAIISWSYSIQSTTDVLDAMVTDIINSTTQPIEVSPKLDTNSNTQLTTSYFNSQLAGYADIYQGTLEIPYYLGTQTGTDVSAIITGSWKTATGNPVTRFDPLPEPTNTQLIPLLMAIPNGNGSAGVKPAGGWPVVIFQHGIFGNRSQMMPIADALATIGVATAAIDLPLHGIVPSAGTPTASEILIEDNIDERHFSLDILDNTTLTVPAVQNPNGDGKIDPSGGNFLNLLSLLTARDNLRQASVDIAHLANSLPSLDLDGDVNTTDIDASRIHFSGISLGSMAGINLLATDGGNLITAGSLSVPGGGIAKLLDGSPAFNLLITTQLSLRGVQIGTQAYEDFLRLAQTAIDAADPINYAKQAVTNHPIHLSEVIGNQHPDTTSPPDLIIPNQVLNQIPYENIVFETAPLSGTEPLINLMGLTPIKTDGSHPVTMGAGVVTRFIFGQHDSLLDPNPDTTYPLPDKPPLVTTEMQQQLLSFIQSDGAIVTIGATDLLQ